MHFIKGTVYGYLEDYQNAVIDIVVSENKAKAESRSESAIRHMEGKAEADASARRMGS